VRRFETGMSFNMEVFSNLPDSIFFSFLGRQAGRQVGRQTGRQADRQAK
jgi:hypothetical protein